MNSLLRFLRTPKNPLFAEWHTDRSQYLLLRSFPACSTQERQDLLEDCDALFTQACSLLQCQPRKVPAHIAMFRNEGEYQQWLGLQAYTSAYTYGSWVYTWAGAFSSVPKRRAVFAHEFSHLCSTQKIARDPVAILEEGLAEYVATTLVPNFTNTPRICLEQSLWQLADKSIFHQWLDGGQSLHEVRCKYAHAHAFVHFLVDWKGISALLQCSQYAGQPNRAEPGERLANAVSQVYGTTLQHLEEHWRNTYPVQAHSAVTEKLQTHCEEPLP